MKDAAFERKMRMTVEAGSKFRALLKEVEEEFERRFGVAPSDVDCDPWIDTFHGSAGEANAPTADSVDTWAKEYCNLERVDGKRKKGDTDGKGSDDLE